MQTGILAGTEIRREVERGAISISPFNEKNLNPASYDVTLGRQVSVYRAVTDGDFEKPKFGKFQGESLFPYACQNPNHPWKHIEWSPKGHLDAAHDHEVVKTTLEHGEGIFLRPGIGYLMHTEEIVATDGFVPVLDGKSSIGRLFTIIHVTAGYGDPGFNGQFTLEVVVTHPTVLYAGMRIGQVRFHPLSGEPKLYSKTGHYRGDKAIGPIPSQAHLQLKADRLLETE